MHGCAFAEKLARTCGNRGCQLPHSRPHPVVSRVQATSSPENHNTAEIMIRIAHRESVASREAIQHTVRKATDFPFVSASATFLMAEIRAGMTSEVHVTTSCAAIAALISSVLVMLYRSAGSASSRRSSCQLQADCSKINITHIGPPLARLASLQQKLLVGQGLPGTSHVPPTVMVQGP